MPMIAELRKIDDALWARVPLTEGAGRLQILSDAEITQNDARTARLLSEIERLRALIADACGVFEHYDLPEHAFHYRRAVEQPSPVKES